MTERRSFHEWYFSLIGGRERGAAARAIRGVLHALSLVYGACLSARASLFRAHIFKSHGLSCVVISVGNLTVGGTGKTPVVEHIARTLVGENRHVAILSRGYHRRLTARERLRALSGGDEPVVVSDGAHILASSETGGDEPYMLAKNIPGIPIIVCPNRVKAAACAIERFGCDTLILDDGFQYLSLKRTVDVVLVDATDPFGNGRLIPAGTLREHQTALARATHVFVTKVSGDNHRPVVEAVRRLNSAAQIVLCAHKPLYLQHVQTGAQRPLDELRDKKVFSLCGIAKPDSFEEALKGIGCAVTKSHRYPDHHRFTEEEVADIVKRAERNGAIVVTTEKDAVRFPATDKKFPIPVYFLKVAIDIVEGQRQFFDSMARINKT